MPFSAMAGRRVYLILHGVMLFAAPQVGLMFVGCHCKLEMGSSIALKRQSNVQKETMQLEFVQVQ